MINTSHVEHSLTLHVSRNEVANVARQVPHCDSHNSPDPGFPFWTPRWLTPDLGTVLTVTLRRDNYIPGSCLVKIAPFDNKPPQKTESASVTKDPEMRTGWQRLNRPMARPTSATCSMECWRGGGLKIHRCACRGSRPAATVPWPKSVHSFFFLDRLRYTATPKTARKIPNFTSRFIQCWAVELYTSKHSSTVVLLIGIMSRSGAPTLGAVSKRADPPKTDPTSPLFRTPFVSAESRRTRVRPTGLHRLLKNWILIGQVSGHDFSQSCR